MSVEDEIIAAVTSETETKPTPAEVVKEAETAAPEAQEGDTADAGEKAEAEQAKTNRKPAAERIAELTRRAKEAEKRALNAESKLKSLETKAPKRDDFETDDEYTAAVAKTVVKDVRRETIADEANDARAEVADAKSQAWQVQREEAKVRLPDFDKVIEAVPADVFSPSVAQAILSSDVAADVAYVLAKDLPRARRFAASTPLEQGREIGRIEAELSGPKPRKISSAPAPVETVGSKGPGSGFNPKTASAADMAKHLGY